MKKDGGERKRDEEKVVACSAEMPDDYGVTSMFWDLVQATGLKIGLFIRNASSEP